MPGQREGRQASVISRSDPLGRETLAKWPADIVAEGRKQSPGRVSEGGIRRQQLQTLPYADGTSVDLTNAAGDGVEPSLKDFGRPVVSNRWRYAPMCCSGIAACDDSILPDDDEGDAHSVFGRWSSSRIWSWSTPFFMKLRSEERR